MWGRIYTRPAAEWNGGFNWDFKLGHAADLDEFFQHAFSNIPQPVSLEYVDALTSNYVLALVGVEGAENKAVRFYEAAYRAMLAEIAASIEESVLPPADSPDSDVEPEDVQVELERWRAATIAPQFLR